MPASQNLREYNLHTTSNLAISDNFEGLGFSPRKTNFLQQLRPRFLYWSLTYTGVCDLTQLHTLEQSQGRIQKSRAVDTYYT